MMQEQRYAVIFRYRWFDIRNIHFKEVELLFRAIPQAQDLIPTFLIEILGTWPTLHLNFLAHMHPLITQVVIKLRP